MKTRLCKVLLTVCLVALLSQTNLVTAQTTPSQKLIKVAIYDHKTDGISGGRKNLEAFLIPANGYITTHVTPATIRDGALDDQDVLIMPGGSGSKQAFALGADGKQIVRDFVASGKGYVGICAGAYLATNHYSWSLGLINAKVVDTKHWARGTGEVTLNLTESGQKNLAYDESSCKVYYGQGPLLAPGKDDTAPKYETLATYATEIAKKGAPTGVMIGTTAIARTQYQNGRVVCFSPHPEKPGGIASLIQHAVTWAATPEDK
ncbi:MAG: biofilm PGA synthesis protein PgaC [Phycisphaeraceae bacterium]|nr:biofilm PGA synthesis protein PgaC [Phycisphaeraceae bacterium]|tara:strand:- start:171 stop:956 length:786 start_codon:yes stop_codon:yes gene_type:complete